MEKDARTNNVTKNSNSDSSSKCQNDEEILRKKREFQRTAFQVAFDS